MRKQLAMLASSALLSGGAVVAVAEPAQAADVKFYVCNSYYSVEVIDVKRGDGLGTTALYPNDCLQTPVIAAGTRVDVDATGTFSLGVDVDSYKIKVDNDNGPCHNGETNDSDPPNVPAKITYRNFRYVGCFS